MMEVVGLLLSVLTGCYIGYHTDMYLRSCYEEQSFPVHSDGNTALDIAAEITEEYTDRYMDSSVEPRALAGVKGALQLRALEGRAAESDNPYWEQLYAREKLGTDLQALATSIQEEDSLRQAMQEVGMDGYTAGKLVSGLSEDDDALIAASMLLREDEHSRSLYREILEPPLNIRIDIDNRDRLFYRPASTT